MPPLLIEDREGLMLTERTIKTIERPDGKGRISIFARSDGFFRYLEEEEGYEDGNPFIASRNFSGIFVSAEAAERDAFASVLWLRAQR